jgi:hypothetical protein
MYFFIFRWKKSDVWIKNQFKDEEYKEYEKDLNEYFLGFWSKAYISSDGSRF